MRNLLGVVFETTFIITIFQAEDEIIALIHLPLLHGSFLDFTIPLGYWDKPVACYSNGLFPFASGHM